MAALDLADIGPLMEDDVAGLVRALRAERRLKRKRLKRLNKALASPTLLSEPTRVRLVHERCEQVVEIADLTAMIREYEGQ